MQKNKRLLLILLFFSQISIFAEETITYKVAIKSDVYSFPEKKLHKGGKKSGSTIIANYPPTINFLSLPDNNIQIQCLFYLENDQNYAISTRDIRIFNSDSLPREKFNYDSTGLTQMVIPAYYVEVLANQDSKKIFEYEKAFARYIAKNAQTTVLGRRIHNYPDEFSAIVSPLHIFLNSGDEIFFKHITKISDSVYECVASCYAGYTTENHDYTENFWRVCVDNTSENQTETFIITIDGDYLQIDNKTRHKHTVTLTYVDDSLIKSLEDLFIDGKSELSKVIWPCRADGSCDYANKNNSSVQVSNQTTTESAIISKNKIMSVSENLKLRSGEATSTPVLTIMSTGTKVKILEFGKSETIDGINSNWVKVEIISGSDRDGNKLKSGITGWCYGGYLE